MSTPSLPPALAAESCQTSTLVVSWLFTGIALVFVSCRMFSRWTLTRNAGWDDHLILISIILQVAFAGCLTKAVLNGIGRHMGALPLPTTIIGLKFALVGQPMSIMALCLPKISVAILIRRFMPPDRTNDWRMLIIYVLCACVFVLGVVDAVTLFVQCNHVSALWYDVTTIPHCWKPAVQLQISIVLTAFSAFVDLYLAFFPAFIFWKLNVKTRTKLALSVLMSLGVFACIAGVIKSTYFHALDEDETNADLTWKEAFLLMWGNIEICTVTIAACVPTLRPFVMYLLGRPLTSLGSEGYLGSSSSKQKGYRAFDESFVASQPNSKKSALYHHHLHDLDGEDLEMGSEARLAGTTPQTSTTSATGDAAVGHGPAPVEPAYGVNGRGIQRVTEIRTDVEHV